MANPERRPARPTLRPTAGPLAVALLLAALTWGCGRSEPVPVLAEVPTFQLTAQDGSRFDSKSLAGRPYVVSFFFTHCPSICPRVMGAMAELLELLPPDVHLVSITVDPDNDTPERLTEYGATIGATKERWSLLTGTREELLGVVEGGFMTHMGDREARPAGLYDIAHGSRLMLVDGDSRLRAIVDPALDEHKSLKRLVESVRSESR